MYDSIYDFFYRPAKYCPLVVSDTTFGTTTAGPIYFTLRYTGCILYIHLYLPPRQIQIKTSKG